jgi:uncharacterized membrane protein YphA (DoxX/SURF4 family)
VVCWSRLLPTKRAYSEFFGGLGLMVGLVSRIAALGVIASVLGVMRFHFQCSLFMNWFGENKIVGGGNTEWHHWRNGQAVMG